MVRTALREGVVLSMARAGTLPRRVVLRMARRLYDGLRRGPLAFTLQWPIARAVHARMVTVRAPDVLVVVTALRHAGVDAWLAGGWAVDAIVGKETRRHGDLDLLVSEDSLDGVATCLTGLGYRLFLQQDFGSGQWMPIRLLFRDPLGRSVDVHPVRLAEGALQAVHGPADRSLPLAESLAVGRLDGQEVACLSPSAQLAFKSGYEWDGDDVRDAVLLRRYLTPSRSCDKPEL